MQTEKEKLKEKYDRIRKDVKAKEARRKQSNNFEGVFNLQNNDLDKIFNGEKK
jgi:hypothetical protein